VLVGLPTAGANAGQIDIAFDAYGQAGPTTEVLIDVVGYMAPTDSYTKAQTDAALAGKANAADVYTTTELDAYFSYADTQIGLALDGKVDKGSPIVMTIGAGEFERTGSMGPTTFLKRGHILQTSADLGVIYMPLSGPTIVGGITYRLSSVEWCLWSDALYGGSVWSASVLHDQPQPGFPQPPFSSAVSDTTPRSAAGCYTLTVPRLPALGGIQPRGYSLQLELAGQTTNLSSASLWLQSVKTTWIDARFD
jgi:hypothetical protein